MSWSEEYAAIKESYLKYIKAWETRNVDVLDEIIIPSLHVNYSIFEPIYSRAVLKERLKTIAIEPTYARFSTQAYVCLIEGNKAQQSAVLMGYYGVDGAQYKHYSFGGYLVNSWEKFEDGWKMTNMKFDLAVDDGSVGMRNEKNEFVRVKGAGDVAIVANWTPIQEDLGVYDGCRLPMICTNFDAPWNVIKNPENQPTDEEQIQELMNRYTFMIDKNGYELLPDLFTPDCSVSMSQLGEMTYPTAVKMLKQMTGIATRLLHMAQIVKLDIDGDFAKAIAYRRAADEMYPFEYTKETEKIDFVAATYTLMFRRDHGKWRISHMAYYPGTFIAGTYKG